MNITVPMKLYHILAIPSYNWAATWQNQQNDCPPSEDSASAQSDQSLHCPHEETFGL